MLINTTINKLLLLVFLATAQAVTGQVFTSSNLPIVKIHTNGLQINQDDKVLADLGIIDNGPDVRNNRNDPFSDYSGLCGIKIRGESSSGFAKKSYSIELWDENQMDIDSSLLGFPKEEDFILYGPFSDKSLVNNVLTMHLAREMGQYASRTRFCEVVINGDYKGLYVLMEKIKRDNDRVDISKLQVTDNDGEELTGGYIFRIDKGNYDGWLSRYENYGNSSKPYYQFYYPNQDVITNPQKEYIENYMHDFEEAASSPTYKNEEKGHYTEYINLRSFVDHFIISELSKNADAYRLSTYFHKQKDSKGGRLYMGPIWDYNLSYGNADYCSTEFTDDFLYYECVGNSPAWWDNFLSDRIFTTALRCRYENLRTGLLSAENMTIVLDSLQNELSEAQARNFERWDIMGQYVWPNSDFFAAAQSHSEVMDLLKNWLDKRLVWLDENMPGVAADCAFFENPDYEVNSTSTEQIPVYPVINIFPNPSTGKVRIRSSEKIKYLEILSLDGRKLLERTPENKQLDLELNLSSGIYVVELSTATSLQRSKLIIR